MRMDIYKCRYTRSFPGLPDFRDRLACRLRYIWPWANPLLLNEICRYFNLLIQVSFENDHAMLRYKKKSYLQLQKTRVRESGSN
jgi:hypothetical protein